MVRIRYLSHSCFELKNGKTLLIDPFFKGNDLAPHYSGKPDLILCTHEHFDHFDPKFISRFDVPVVCPETCRPARPEYMKVGDRRRILGISIEMFSASHHQSKYPTGYVIEYEGRRLAHLGDMYIDGVKPLHSIDILMVPIGGHFTMNIDEALKATKMISPKLVIPMHYNTFPEIKANPEEFRMKAEGEGFNASVFRIDEEKVF